MPEETQERGRESTGLAAVRTNWAILIAIVTMLVSGGYCYRGLMDSNEQLKEAVNKLEEKANTYVLQSTLDEYRRTEDLKYEELKAMFEKDMELPRRAQ